MPVVSAEKPHSSGTAPVAPGRLYCGQDAEAVPAAPAPAAQNLISFAPALPPNAMVFQVGEASVLLLNWLLIVVKSGIVVLLSRCQFSCDMKLHGFGAVLIAYHNHVIIHF